MILQSKDVTRFSGALAIGFAVATCAAWARADEEGGADGSLAPPDAGAAPAHPAYDAGDGITPLSELPTWGEHDDHDGCSCRVAGRRDLAFSPLAYGLGALALVRPWRAARNRRAPRIGRTAPKGGRE
jgi:hypothetical protein